MTTDVSSPAAPIVVASFYKFVTLAAPREVATRLGARARELGLLGTLLFAEEGLNASVAGAPQVIAEFLAYVRAQPGFDTLGDVRESLHAAAPFRRLKIKIKREIVSMGVADIAPAHMTGTHVEPRDWHALLASPDLLLIDARNSYEHRVGSFAGALDLGMHSFREFPARIDAELARSGAKSVAMFCTGGIRCEKASAYLLAHGCQEVYQLSGGILRYLEETPREESQWQGECFVFDQRVALDTTLTPGEHQLCFACRHPLNAADRASPLYRQAECCPYCHGRVSEQRRRAFAERGRQVALAATRDEVHLGAVMTSRKR